MKSLVLDDRQFSRLCAVLGVASDGLFSESRRVEARVPIQVAVVEDKMMGVATTCTLRDLSKRGATLLNQFCMVPGTSIVFCLGGEEEPIRVLGKVTHNKNFADGTAMVSIEFSGFVDPKGRAMPIPGEQLPRANFSQSA